MPKTHHYTLLEVQDDAEEPVVFRIQVTSLGKRRGRLEVWPDGIAWIPRHGKSTAETRQTYWIGGLVRWDKLGRLFAEHERGAARDERWRRRVERRGGRVR